MMEDTVEDGDQPVKATTDQSIQEQTDEVADENPDQKSDQAVKEATDQPVVRAPEEENIQALIHSQIPYEEKEKIEQVVTQHKTPPDEERLDEVLTDLIGQTIDKIVQEESNQAKDENIGDAAAKTSNDVPVIKFDSVQYDEAISFNPYQPVVIVTRIRNMQLDDTIVPRTMERITSRRIVCRPPYYEKEYVVDYVFSRDSTQFEVYNFLISPLTERALDGYDSLVFTYGHTGTGKSYTTLGNMPRSRFNLEESSMGMMPRAVMDIFRRTANERSKYKISVSVVEVYRNKAWDFFRVDNQWIYADKRVLKSMNCASECKVENYKGFCKLLDLVHKEQAGFKKYGTSNSEIIMIYVVTIRKSLGDKSGQQVGHIIFTDLARSEHMGKMDETELVNGELPPTRKSLFALSKMILAVKAKLEPIPYIQSKLTSLLRKFFAPGCRIGLITTLSPCAYELEENTRSLDFTETLMFDVKNLHLQLLQKRHLEQPAIRLQQFAPSGERRDPPKKAQPIVEEELQLPSNVVPLTQYYKSVQPHEMVQLPPPGCVPYGEGSSGQYYEGGPQPEQPTEEGPSEPKYLLGQIVDPLYELECMGEEVPRMRTELEKVTEGDEYMLQVFDRTKKCNIYSTESLYDEIEFLERDCIAVHKTYCTVAENIAAELSLGMGNVERTMDAVMISTKRQFIEELLETIAVWKERIYFLLTLLSAADMPGESRGPMITVDYSTEYPSCYFTPISNTPESNPSDLFENYVVDPAQFPPFPLSQDQEFEQSESEEEPIKDITKQVYAEEWLTRCKDIKKKLARSDVRYSELLQKLIKEIVDTDLEEFEQLRAFFEDYQPVFEADHKEMKVVVTDIIENIEIVLENLQDSS